eukprot:gb/GFBE01068108.1/.p1 GENE.gb/GFBE01068108.1/~~gb/GFBE01068108.1/.p1  ORF type:complete len:433 (+),score=100.97 gb/GFBE01068108.1/:1-1299(+)
MKYSYCLAVGLGLRSAAANKLRASDFMEPEVPENFWESSNVEAKCASYTCSDGWIANREEYDVVGSSDIECCKKTCALYPCGDGYKDNPAYGDNVGENNQDCCDKKCSLSAAEGLYNCTEGWAINDDHPGVTGADCCIPTCAVWKCGPMWAPNMSAREVVAQSDEECCEAACASVRCEPGHVHDDLKVDRPFENEEECCVPSCQLYTCPAINGSHPWSIPEDQLGKKAYNYTDCCEPQCRHYNCSEGYLKDDTKGDLFSPTDEKCCLQQCKIHACPHGWFIDEARSHLVGNSKEECCTPSCLDYECDVDAGWVNIGKDIPGNTSKICCDKSCFLKRCPNGFRTAPQRNLTLGSSRAVCCHNDQCSDLQKEREQLDSDHHCNSVQGGEEACHKHYEKFVVENGTDTVYVKCQYDANFGLCRLSEHEIQGCIEV